MKILLVEDEHKIANSIKKGLMQESYVVDVSFDGTHGYDLASSEHYDAIILDLMLPGINGLDICKKLRASHIHTPILILTAKGQLDDKVQGLNSGADDYLVKPFAFAELVARIKALARRPKQSVDETVRVKDITLNATMYEVYRGKKFIQLSHKEFSLLEYFMRHPNKVLTKDQIANHVWSYESDILPNTIEVYVGYLRHKLGTPNVIETVRGFGYKMTQ